MILVATSKKYYPEKVYILNVILWNFLGLDFEILESEESESDYTTITYKESGLKLELSQNFFSTIEEEWLQLVSLPKRQLKFWKLPDFFMEDLATERCLPVIYGNEPNESNFFIFTQTGIRLGLDILGSIFFMLTRYEEYVKITKEQFDRFPASASLAYQEDFLQRPIVNEYVEVLWVCLKKLWPVLKRKSYNFKVQVSHDVDSPYQYAFAQPAYLAKKIASDVLKHRNLNSGISRVQRWQQVKQGDLSSDPHNTFDWLMNLSETYNLTSAFYFITAHTDSQKDGDYDIEHPLIRKLLRRISQRGHEIGLHPSFNTYLDSEQTCKEFKLLQTVCKQEGIQQSCWGGRQHYLRWRLPNTWQNWEDVGLNYDSTLTFADVAGFRCGTCYEFPVYNLLTRKALKLVERPLIVMECSVLDERYMGLNKNLSEAFNYIVNLKKLCRTYNGNFTLLWHNSRFESPEYRELYQQILAA